MSGGPDVGLVSAATRELVEAFAAAASTGDVESLGALLSHDVVYQVPGRSRSAGLHRGAEQVIAVLHTPAVPDADVTSVTVTEVMSEGRRSFVVLAMAGVDSGTPFRFEVGFHLQTDGEYVIGITEYSGDQYQADRLLGDGFGGEAAAGDAGWRRWFRKVR
jgi:ketosteroid isomerase-like protein